MTIKQPALAKGAYIIALICVQFFQPSWAQLSEPIEPLPAAVDIDSAKAAIGKKLFFDTRLSVDGSISCVSCHDIVEGWGAEGRKVSQGVKQQLGSRNSPTVFNATFNFKQFWDGRADTLSHQVEFPVVNPVEMGMPSWDEVIDRLKKDDYYPDAVQSAFGQGLSIGVVSDAIAEFQKTLVTANSPFDQYLLGDTNAINDTQKRGYELFKSYGCVACHQGKNVGGNMFQKFGVLEDISLSSGTLSNDLGRYAVTRNEWDKRVFKVPSLRLAVLTPPYFHDGSVASIEEAVATMIRFQLGRDVPSEDRDAIIAFLGSLAGDRPE